MVNPSDEDLMRQLQNGDSNALGLIYERHSEKVWSYISKRLPKEAAEDLFQDCFVKLVEKRDSWKNQPFLLWLYVVLRNLVTDFHRSNKVEKKYLDKMSTSEEPIVDGKDFQELVANMPPETSRLLTEFFKEGWSYKELASKYELTEESLRKRMSRALAVLKKGVSDE
jgi:RNA polymerase sigma-70 factor (ECF subfamily)